MGSVAVMAWIASYLQGLNLPYVGTIYQGRPMIIPEEDYDYNVSTHLVVTSTHGSSGIIIIDLPSDRRTRESMTGRGAVDDKWVHDVHLGVYLANTSGDALAAAQDQYTLRDAIMVGIRADGEFGNPSVFFSVGEFGDGINIGQHEPFQAADGTTIFLPFSVTFEAWEWITGPVPR